MQRKFRDNIKQNIPTLVDSIDPDELARHLLKKKVLNNREIKKILSEKGNAKHKNRLLLFQILKKTDVNYEEFVKILENSKLEKPFSSNNPRTHATVFNQGNQNTPDVEHIGFSNSTINSSLDRASALVTKYDIKPLDVRVKLATNFHSTELDNVYDTTSYNRGRVLIINNRVFESHSTRKGSQQDVKGVESLFNQMFLKVEIHEELSVLEMKKVIQRFTQYDSDKISDMCIVIIMSHGEERENNLVVLDKSNDGLSTSWIEEQFSNVNCVLFYGKPKIFFYQICRGSRNDEGITDSKGFNPEMNLVNSYENNNNDSVQTDSGHMIPPIQRRLEDMLVGYATQKGRRAHRDVNLGSWYIQLIIEVFMEKAHNTDIVNMLNEVDRKLKGKTTCNLTMQTSSYTSNGFNKLLYFNPGIYMDNVGNIQRFV